MAQRLALPLKVDGRGRFGTVEVGSIADVAQCVAVVLATPVGSRVEIPEFGSPRPEFTGPDLAGMVAAVDEWEPRASLTVEALGNLPDGESVVRIKAFVAPRL